LAWLYRVRQIWRGEKDAGPIASGGFVVLCLALATAARWGIAQIRDDVPFTLYIPAVLLTTVFGGLRVGVLAAVLGAVLGYAIGFNGTPTGSAPVALLAIYVVVSSLTMWGAQHYRSIALYYRNLSEQLRKEEAYRQLVVGELSHRLRNSLATVHAVVHQVLLDQPQAWAAVDGRLRALVAADDLISRSDRRGCDIAELLRLETAPYGDSRVTLLGNPLHIPPKLAVSLDLMFHELATNAAKHGALSTPAGFLQISWRMVGDRLSVIWDENNGPPVTQPGKTGFGTRLLASALAAFDGQVQTDYLAAGLHCIMSCKMPADLDDVRGAHGSRS
jgi:two-component sensor histidine kinase